MKGASRFKKFWFTEDIPSQAETNDLWEPFGYPYLRHCPDLRGKGDFVLVSI